MKIQSQNSSSPARGERQRFRSDGPSDALEPVAVLTQSTRTVRALALFTLLLSTVVRAEIEVPVDVAVGPAGWWFFGPLVENR